MHKFSLKSPLERKRLPNYRLLLRLLEKIGYLKETVCYLTWQSALWFDISYQGQKELQQKIIMLLTTYTIPYNVLEILMPVFSSTPFCSQSHPGL